MDPAVEFVVRTIIPMIGEERMSAEYRREFIEWKLARCRKAKAEAEERGEAYEPSKLDPFYEPYLTEAEYDEFSAMGAIWEKDDPYDDDGNAIYELELG